MDFLGRLNIMENWARNKREYVWQDRGTGWLFPSSVEVSGFGPSPGDLDNQHALRWHERCSGIVIEWERWTVDFKRKYVKCISTV